MRKKGKTMEDLEFYSVMRSIRAIENSDVCILMIDARQGLESQDLNIHNLIVRNRKGCVIVVNKWDLIEKDSNTMKEWTEFLRKKLAPFNDIPIIFTSVLNKQRIFDVLQTAIRVYQSRKRRIPTSELNDYMLPLIEKMCIRDRGHHVAETHDEEARKHGSEQSFVYFVYAHPRRNFGFQIFQSYIFFRKKRVSGGDYFTIAPLRRAADTIQ